MSPSSSRIPSPSLASSARRTSGSLASRWWTISSLETVAAPWRAKNLSAVLLPVPIPPVIATATGRLRALLLVVGRCRSLRLGGLFGLGSRFGLFGRVGLLRGGLRLVLRFRRAGLLGRGGGGDLRLASLFGLVRGRLRLRRGLRLEGGHRRA